MDGWWENGGRLTSNREGNEMMGSNAGQCRRIERENDQVRAEKGKLISFGLALCPWDGLGNPLLIQPALQG